MAQVLKEVIRERIKKSALAVFFEKGFKGATMGRIAAGAEVPTGLIYSYFKNKEDLFESILTPVRRCIGRILSGERSLDKPEDNLFKHELPELLACMSTYHREMVMLIDKSEGSPMSEMKDEILREMTVHMRNSPILKHTNFDDRFYHILATNFMEGVFEIVRHYEDKKWSEMMLYLLIRQHLDGVRGVIT
jgi:AcrR family transcriptional regulator